VLYKMADLVISNDIEEDDPRYSLDIGDVSDDSSSDEDGDNSTRRTDAEDDNVSLVL